MPRIRAYYDTTRPEHRKTTPSPTYHWRCWCWRFWLITSVLPVVIFHARTGETANSLTGAILSFNITQISSPLSMEALTGVSSDQCKPWLADGAAPSTLTWSYESRLLLLSISNIYELYDFTTMASYYTDFQYSPSALSLKNVPILDAAGLGFHLGFNATPLCGSTRLPTKVLCSDGLVLSINKTVLLNDGHGTVTQSLCGGRYFVSYVYAYSCANSNFAPPSCKSSCRPATNATHCYACDENDGQRRCCPGSAEPDCTLVAADTVSVSSSESQAPFGSIAGSALTVIISLSVLSVLLFSACALFCVLLLVERKRNRRYDAAKSRTNGWLMKNGHAITSDQKNGTCYRVNGSAKISPVTATSLLKANGGLQNASDSSNGCASSNTSANGIVHLPPLAMVTGVEKRRPASCDPCAIETDSRRRQKLDVHGLYSSARANGDAVPRARAPPESDRSFKPTKDNFTKRRDLGTLF